MFLKIYFAVWAVLLLFGLGVTAAKDGQRGQVSFLVNVFGFLMLIPIAYAAIQYIYF